MEIFFDDLNFDFSELENLIEDGLQSRKKKNNKHMEKKSRRIKISTGHYSRLNRKMGRKKNYESKWGDINFHENILEDEIPTKTMERKRKVIYKSKCECAYFHSQGDSPDIDADILEDEASQISFITQYDDDIYADKNGVIYELYTSMGDFSFDMPEELLIEILTQLPLKSLARFMCVSKKFHSLILNVVPMTNVPKLLILSRSQNKKKVSFHSLDKKTHVESVCSPMEDHLLRDHKVKVHSSCHGLLLIQINYDLFVWNPLTKFFRKVLTIYCLQYETDMCYSLADLCFDFSINEYMVVFVKKCHSYFSSWENFFSFTCGTQRWAHINVPHMIKNVSKGPFFKGYRHWICKSGFPTFDEFHNNSFVPPPQGIVYFDPSTNNIIEFPAPQPKEGDHNFLRDTFLGLGVIEECLCLTRWFRSYGSNIEFLLMKEYGNGNSWEVMFVFSNLPEFFCYGSIEPLFKTKEGEVLLSMNMCYSDLGVKGYDLDHNFLRDLLSWTKTGSFDVVLYEESCHDWEQFFPEYCNCQSNYSDTSFECDSYWSDDSSYWYDLFNYDDYYFDLSELGDSDEEEFPSRKKKRNKKMEKKSHRIKIATKHSRIYPSCRALLEIRRRKKGRKGNKRIYKSKCRYINI